MSLFEKENKTPLSSVIDTNKDKLLIVKSSTGSGKSYSIRQKILKELENNENCVIIVLLTTLSELQDFYFSLVAETNNKGLPSHSIIRRTSKYRSYPVVDCSPTQKKEIDSAFSDCSIKGIPFWLKNRLTKFNPFNTEVFLVSSVYAEGKNQNFNTSLVWGEIIDFIRVKRYFTENKQDNEIIKELGPFTSLLFVDEADQVLGKKLIKNHKLRNFYGKYTKQAIFSHRNRESSLLDNIAYKDNLEKKGDFIYLKFDLQLVRYTSKYSLTTTYISPTMGINNFQVMFKCEKPILVETYTEINHILDIYICVNDQEYLVLESVNENPKFHLDNFTKYINEILGSSLNEVRLPIINTCCRFFTLLLASNTNYLSRSVALDRRGNVVKSHEEAQVLYNEFKRKRNISKKGEKVKFTDFLQICPSAELYTYRLITLNTSFFFSNAQDFNSIICLSATWDEDLLRTFINNPPLLSRVNFYKKSPFTINLGDSMLLEKGYPYKHKSENFGLNHEVDNLLLFLNSTNFQAGMAYCSISPLNFEKILLLKLKENFSSRTKTIKNLKYFLPELLFDGLRKPAYLYEKADSLLQEILNKKNSEISSIDVFSNLLDLTFNAEAKYHHIKGFHPVGSSNILNPTLSLSPNFCSIEFPIKRTKLIEFGLKDQSSIKIKPLIITCFYVGSNINKKGLPDGLSEKYIIAQSFSNLLFNMNFKKEINSGKGEKFPYLKILNLFQCYTESEDSHKALGEIFSVVQESGRVPVTPKKGFNQQKDLLDFLETEDRSLHRKKSLQQENKREFLSSRDVLNQQVFSKSLEVGENNLTFPISAQEFELIPNRDGFWEKFFGDFIFSSKQGVFFSALNLPEYNFIAIYHARLPSQGNFIYDSQNKEIYLKSIEDLYTTSMVQPLGRNTRISFEERANYKIWGNKPRRVYFISNFGTLAQLKKSKKQLELQKEILLNEFTKNPIFDELIFKHYDYGGDLINDLPQITDKMEEFFVSESVDFTTSIQTQTTSSLKEESMLVSNTRLEYVKEYIFSQILEDFKEGIKDGRINLEISNIQVIIKTSIKTDTNISRPLASYFNNNSAVLKEKIFSILENLRPSKRIFLCSGVKSVDMVISNLASYLEEFFPVSKKAPTVVLCLLNLTGVGVNGKNISETVGKPFLVQGGFPVPKYKYSLKDETEKSRNSFIQVSDQILSDENFLKLVKSKFINFKTTNGIKIKGDNFQINKTKQNQPELSFEISIEQFNKIPL